MSWIKTNQKQYKNEQKRIDEYMDYKMEKAMKSHKEGSVLDHPDGCVTDEKIGVRTVVDSSTDSGDFTGLFSAIINNIANAIRSVRANFTTHKNNNYIHITDKERQTWNNTLDESNAALEQAIEENRKSAEEQFAKKSEMPTKKTLGLDKVDNTPDSEKYVLHATDADNSRWADTAGTADVAVMDIQGNYIAEHYATKNEVSTIPKFNILPVTSLPTENISTTTVYLVPYGDESQNIYDEYIYVDGTWEKLGTQKVDLSGYALKSELPTKETLGLDKVDNTSDEEKQVNYALYAEHALKDGFGNDISSQYATKEEVGDIETALDEIITIQNTLIGGDSE